jgi:hypothetical protein
VHACVTLNAAAAADDDKLQELPALGSKVLDIKSPELSSDELQFPEKQLTPRRPKWDSPGTHSRDFSTHKLGKNVAGGDGKKKYTARECEVHAAHKKQSETGYICKLYVVPLHRESF